MRRCFEVTLELIAKIRTGAWNPGGNPGDRQQIPAIAAKGCWQAFRQVKKSVARLLNGEHPGRIVRQDYSDWYRALFSESVRAGLLETYHLAGQTGDWNWISPAQRSARAGTQEANAPQSKG